MYFSEYDSPIGTLTLTSNGNDLTGVFMHSKAGLTRRDELPVFLQAKDWLNRYFRGERPAPTSLPLSPSGTAFQIMVWQILLSIPYGESRTYGDIAREIAAVFNKDRMSPQAIGSAVGRNPISIIIPCHRILGAGGKLTGYAGGLAAKTILLRHEGISFQEETQ